MIIPEHNAAIDVTTMAMLLFVLLISSCIAAAPNASAVPLIRHIKIEGNTRIPAASILHQISAAPDMPFDPAKSQADLKKLYGLGLFEDLQIQSLDAGLGSVDIVYKIREYPFISSFSVEGVDEGLEKRIREYLQKEKLELRPATPFSPSAANKAALAVRGFLRSLKHPNASTRIVTEREGDAVRVSLYVQPGQRLEVGAVRFFGNESVPQNELLRQMRYSHPAHFWARWMGAARYVPEELNSDLQQVALYYKSRGFAAVSLGEPRVQATSVRGKQRLEIEIPVAEGARYRLTSVKIEGNAKAGTADVEQLADALQVPCDYNYSLLESTRQKMADALGHHGYAMAQVQLEQSYNEADRTIQAKYKVVPGDPVAIGRIEFQGNFRVPDRFLRRELRIAEGDVFDTAKLDQSVKRLNKSNLLHEVRRSDVALKMNAETDLLDVTFHVKEKERQGIYATGGTGGIGGGYLGILYTAFNFLHLGETLSLELDGGASQSNLLLDIVGTHFLGSPFTLALSVFNKYMGFNVANIVPGPEDLVGVLRQRSTGAGLSGTYPVTGDLQAGLSFEAERDLVTDVQAADTTRSLRSELAPFVIYDRTRGSGSETRGYRLSFSQGWDGSLFLKSLDSTRESVQWTHYIGDPWTHGRNSFAFHFQGSWVRPYASGPLFPERRFYPGDETVRGFSRGSLSPWAAVPSASGSTLQAAGADTVLGFSTEYRVPIQGALSGAAFFDLGWTHLNSNDAAQLGAGARLLEETNGVLRASLGGEVRLQLPIIRQPARLIFSWNPLRLNTVFSNSSSVLSLVEPRTAIRFALGTFY